MKTCPCNEHPLAPHFYMVKVGLTGVYMFYLFFALKHRSWVLIRTASVRWFLRVPTIYVLSKINKNITFSSENYHFYNREILQYIAWTCLCNVTPFFFVYCVHVIKPLVTRSYHASNKKAMNRNRSNQKPSPALKTKMGNNKNYK